MLKLQSALAKRLVMPLLGIPLLLSGCATLSGNCSAIPIREYDTAFRNRLADELEKAGEGSAVSIFVSGAIELRDAVRACKGQ